MRKRGECSVESNDPTSKTGMKSPYFLLLEFGGTGAIQDSAYLNA